jgi:competence protein ComEC
MHIDRPYRPISLPRLRFARVFSRLFLLALLFSCLAAPHLAAAQAGTAQAGAGQLRIYFIDVEGGQSTLLVSPSGQSLLIDTGWVGNNNRDVDRIQAAMRTAGVTRIDYLLITHYHIDHVGGVPELARRVPVGEFLDHGPNREDNPGTVAVYNAYLKAVAGHRRIVHPGDTIPIAGLSVTVLAADGEHISAVPGIRPVPNPYCAGEPAWPPQPNEDARSAGVLVTYGKFKFLDLGDLTGGKEIALVCPRNPIGTVDLYLADHHGGKIANSHAIVDALHPRVAIMENGPHKDGNQEAWETVHASPSLEDLWQLHTAEDSDAAHNSADALIANPKGDGDGYFLEATASPSGSFTVTNARTGVSREYPSQ